MDPVISLYKDNLRSYPMKYKKLICPQEGLVELKEYEVPMKPEGTQVVIKNTHGAEKHGTMQSFVSKYGNKRGAWDQKRQMHTPGKGVVWGYPIPLGNMQVGYVESAGPEVVKLKKGDKVVHFSGFEPVSVNDESRCWKINEETSWQAAVCLDPASFALAAVRDGNLRAGDSAAVFSLGAIGLMAVIMAKLSGAYPIIAIDPVKERRDIALKLGAHKVLDPLDEKDLGAKLRELTNWKGLDVIIEYSGSMQAMQAALRGIAFGGNIVAGGFPGPWPAGLDLGGEAHMNRPNLIFSRTESDPNRDHPRWDNDRIRETVLRMILDGLIDGESVVGPIKSFSDDLADEYQQVMAHPEWGAKMGIEY
jgi:threonine dehydrogenase-like Zn-dependent dehydrogenase